MYGQLLKQYSLETGIGQKEIAEKLHYSPQRVNNYYRDVAEPPKEFLDKFAKVFGVDLKLLASRNGKGKSPIATYNPIPVYDLELKQSKELDFFNHDELIVYYIDAPLFNDCFAAIKISSAAMSPAFNPNDILLIRAIKNFDTVPYGEPFIIITDEQRLIRYIRKNESDEKKFFTLKAESPNADDIHIKKSDIKYLFQVKGKIVRR